MHIWLSTIRLLSAALIVSLWPSHAAVPRVESHVEARAAVDQATIAAFLDRALPEQLVNEHIAGAAVAVVSGDAVLLTSGYGWADVERQRPVVAEQTLFPTGSTGKLFVWTAVMQLVEQGRLDLDADVNRYLDFTIPATFAAPITLRHLLSHSAGFEDQIALYAHDIAEIVPAGQYLARHVPRRVRAPGSVSAYSNYGAALAGYIVERVAGQPFERYVADQIFAPLGMRNTTFDQPPPPELAARLTSSYSYANEAFHLVPPKYIRTPATGASVATVADMARFMLAHLNGGGLGAGPTAARVLQPATVARMQTQLFAMDPRVSGFAYGFAETTLNGQRILRHEGEVPGNGCSALMLIPEQRLGLYVAYNGMCDMTTGTRLWHALLDQLYPVPAEAAFAPSAASQAGLAGTYRSTRRADSTYGKLLVLLGGAMGDIRVSAGPDGTLVTTGLGPERLRWAPRADGVWRPADGADTLYGGLVFRDDLGGQGRTLLIANLPYRAYERVPWYATGGFALVLLAICAVSFASTLVLLTIGVVLRRLRRASRAGSAALRRARRLAAGAATLNLLFPLGLALVGVNALTFGATPSLLVALSIPLLSAVVMGASVVFAARSWHDRAWGGAIGRLHYAAVLGSEIAGLAWLGSWNLLGFRF